jgi:hypothetical protein
MTRLALLFITAALVLPGAASAAAPDRDTGTRAALNAHAIDPAAAAAKDGYYAAYGSLKTPELAASTSDPFAASGNGPSWFGALGIGLGLILLAGGTGVYAGRSLRPRRLGA